METLIEIIRNRPALFIRYACYICFALYCIITTVSKKHKVKQKDEKQGEIIMGLFDKFKKKSKKEDKAQVIKEQEEKDIPYVYRELIINTKKNMSLPELVSVFEDMCKIPVDVQSDMLLCETGTYTFSSKENFYFSLVRQFSDNAEGDFKQLQMNILYEPSEYTKDFKLAIWNTDVEEDFFDFIKNSVAYIALQDKKVGNVKIGLYDN